MIVERSSDPRLVKYPHRLNWYQIPPPFEITIEEFETFALDRLQVLKAIETAQVRNLKADQLKNFTSTIVKKYLPLSSTSRADPTREQRQAIFEERRKDHISHFLLRLAYCRTEDLRLWFVKMETELFKLRLLDELPKDREEFLRRLNLSISAVDPSEAEALGIDPKMFKVYFTKVPELVSKRLVLVKGGFAYVPDSMQTVLIVNEFRAHLESAMIATAKALPRMDDDDRLQPILHSISQQYVTVAKEFNAVAGKVSHADIDSLSAHFPLCMSSLHNSLRQDGHLKHSARLQYGLFLKGIGLPMEEALVFWRKAFFKMTDDQFQKGGYAYNIRHNYGMEGKRANYTPYSCVKIITTNHPGAGENHGCPFRHYNQDNLRTLLMQKVNSSTAVNELLKMVTDGHYQVACTRLYEMTKNIKEKVDTIEHPNMWFESSFKGIVAGIAPKQERAAVPVADPDDSMIIDEDEMKLMQSLEDETGIEA